MLKRALYATFVSALLGLAVWETWDIALFILYLAVLFCAACYTLYGKPGVG